MRITERASSVARRGTKSFRGRLQGFSPGHVWMTLCGVEISTCWWRLGRWGMPPFSRRSSVFWPGSVGPWGTKNRRACGLPGSHERPEFSIARVRGCSCDFENSGCQCVAFP